jgi:hypothetical protein
MFVMSAPGTRCPKESNPREYITDQKPGEEVPDSAYYIRLVADGSLIPAAPVIPAEAGIQEKAKTKGGK